MDTSRSRAPTTVPNRYDVLAGIVVLPVLAWTFLYAHRLIFSLLLLVAFGTTYAAGRVDNREHAVVLAGPWGVVLAAVWFTMSFLGLGVAAILAVVGYGYWRGAW